MDDVAIQKDLVYDVGFFDGLDTAYYLRSGYRVVAVDASPDAVRAAAQTFEPAIRDGRLILEHGAVVASGGPETVTLYVSEERAWSSLIPSIAGRDGLTVSEIDVPSTTIGNLVERFGTPYYLKIDVEGMDEIVLKDLASTTARPTFVSAEAESPGDSGTDDAEALRRLSCLVELGYSRFKLVDQDSLRVLSPTDLALGPRRNVRARIRGLLERRRGERRHVVRLNGKRTVFPFGASGPFGHDLAGEWLDEDHARGLLAAARQAYFRREDARAYGFWCDWHATE